MKTRFLAAAASAALLIFLAGRLSADCSTPPNSGWGSGYAAYAAWCRACGGTPYNNNGVGCRPGDNWGGAAQPPDYRAEQERQEQERLALEAARQKKAAKKKKLEEEEKKRKEEEDREFRRRQAEGVQNLKGISAGGRVLKGAVTDPAQLKGMGEGCARDEDLSLYHRRENERKEILGNLGRNLASGKTEKYRADWCKLNIPLPPSPAAAGYCEKKPVYEARMQEWRLKCSAVAARIPAAAAPPRAGAAAAKPLRDAADCLGVYDGEVKACGGSGMEAVNCINRAVITYLRCLTGEALRVGSGN